MADVEVAGWRSVCVCDECWERRSPGREPCRLMIGLLYQRCHGCGKPTSSGIYVRVDTRVEPAARVWEDVVLEEVLEAQGPIQEPSDG